MGLLTGAQSGVVRIDGQTLEVETLVRAARYKTRVEVAEEAWERVKRARDCVEEVIAQEKVVYGINTGFGRFSEVMIDSPQLRALQTNLIRSHAAGTGPPLSEETVRAVMILRANALIKGHSGVRPIVVKTLVDMVNSQVHPVIPSQGSVGASGDLAPLAHLSLVLLGEGKANFWGETLPGLEALNRARLDRVELEAKEGLALINGTQLMAAQGCLAIHDGRELARTADAIASLTVEALRGVGSAFDEKITLARPHRGPQLVGRNLRRLMEGSSLITMPGQLRVQDAYSLRCIPQVHGASRDAIAFVADMLQVEINSATDNPLIFADTGDIISGGNFHGQPLALGLDFLGMALAELGSISERRTDRLLNPVQSGLPAFLAYQGGLNSGMMILQYTAAALVSENKLLASPASVDSIPTSGGQEDHVSMGSVAAGKLERMSNNLARILAIELLCAGQAMDMLGTGDLGRGTKAVFGRLRHEVEPVFADRSMAAEIDQVADLILQGEFSRAATNVIGLLE